MASLAGSAGAQHQPNEAAPAAQENYDMEADPCVSMMRQFQECLQQVEGDGGMAACKFPLDQLRECRYNNNQTPEF